MSTAFTNRHGGLSRQGLDRLRDLLARHIGAGAAPGVVAYLSRHGDEQVVTVGATTVDGAAPLRQDAIFRISSMTKPITATATMALVDDGMLTLDEPVDRWLPELANQRVLRSLDAPLDDTVPARRPITARDLLTFTMGFGIVLAPPDTYPIQSAMERLSLGQGVPAPSSFPPPDEWLRRLGSLPLMAQPGERWMYNTGADVLGVLIARVSGAPFDQFLKQRLFDPLGMKDTGFFVPPEKLDWFAPELWTNPGTGATEVYDPVTGGQWNAAPAFPSGAAGLVSTADDFAAFSHMLLNGGEHKGTRILSRASVAAMTINQLTPEQEANSGPILHDGRGWGFGIAVFTRPSSDGRSAGAFGWEGGLGTSWGADPGEDLTAMLFTHRMWESAEGPDLYRDFWKAVYAALA